MYVDILLQWETSEKFSLAYFTYSFTYPLNKYCVYMCYVASLMSDSLWSDGPQPTRILYKMPNIQQLQDLILKSHGLISNAVITEGYRVYEPEEETAIPNCSWLESTFQRKWHDEYQ